MKAKEWIDKIQDRINRNMIDVEIDQEAVDEIKSIMEKATPKKPNWIYDDEPLCPNCGDVLDGTEEHCDGCDQRLDWSEW